MILIRRWLVLVALAATLAGAATALSLVDGTGGGTVARAAGAVAARPAPPARVCDGARCAPGHAPGVSAPSALLLGLGAVSVAGVLSGAPRRKRGRSGGHRTPVGFPSVPFRPPIAV